MAFCGKLGMLVRQNGQPQMASMLTSLRFMSQSQTKLFIGGLSFGVDDNSLKEAFSGFGDVVEARVITDRDTGRSRGFGFVSFSTNESANSAVSAMDGQDLNGRSVRVSFAADRPSGPRSYGGNNRGNYGGDGGNYGGNSRGYGGGNYRGGDGGY